MAKVNKEAALRYHSDPIPGKIEVVPTKPYTSQLDLSLAYSPGVAYPCLEIEKDPADVYKYTNKGNLVGVVSNGTAVLGLGDIGPLAGKPVMEGKALLFKIFAGLDAFDIEVNETDPDKFVDIVKAISPTFGGINLEDIKAPQCFEIERRLKEECDIPVMHDDQHGTAIISAAALLNALELQDKAIADVRLVVNGAGAAAISCTRLYLALGVRKDNIVMCDSKGVIRADNPDLSPTKREFATSRNIHTLAEALVDADVFLGLSKANVLTPDMLSTMAPRPIVFALANPDPEIAYEEAMASRDDIIFATGRSDYPNQINNVLGFPYIFRGALDCRACCINEEMKIAAVKAIARLAHLPVPKVVDTAYGTDNLRYGPDYILPKPLDPRLLMEVAPAVARAAGESGVAAAPITDFEGYVAHLEELMGKDNRLMRRITDLAKSDPKRVVFSEGSADNVVRAAARLHHDGICVPILLGNPDEISKLAAGEGLNIEGIEIIDVHDPATRQKREEYADRMYCRLHRDGTTRQQALHKMFNTSYYGMMMVECGDADAFVGGTYAGTAGKLADIARNLIGIRSGNSVFATMHIVTTRRGTFFLADTAINPTPDAAKLAEIARLANNGVCFFAHRPVIAMLSYSTFGSQKDKTLEPGQKPRPGSPDCVAEAVAKLHLKMPTMVVDGEMQPNIALDTELRDRLYPFNRLKGKKVNTLVFPDMNSANITYRMLLEMGVGEIIGPIQLGLNKAVHFINTHSAVRDIVNLAAIAAVDAATNSNRDCITRRCCGQ